MAEQGRERRQDLDQQRAAFAWKSAMNCNDKYANLAKSASALVMNNGLMQTLAFYASKAKKDEEDHHRKLCEDICGWLEKRGFSISADSPFRRVMGYLHGSSSPDYRRATEEALALLRWIRQFASALTTKD